MNTMTESRGLFEWELANLVSDEDIYSLPGISLQEDVGRFSGVVSDTDGTSPSPVNTPDDWPVSSVVSPTPYEELSFAMDIDEIDSPPFLLELASEVLENEEPQMLPFDKRLEATSKSLAQSMKRSQETRMCLAAKTAKTEHYERRDSVRGVMESVEKSTKELQSYLLVESKND